MKLAVVSDLHWTTAPAIEASWHNRFDFAGLSARIESARAAFERAAVDAVVACGDITHSGDEASARAALGRLCSPVTQPLFVVAGNHDCLERDHQLERCLPDGADMLTASGADFEGVRVAGVVIQRDAEDGTFRWSGARELAPDGRLTLVASHFPVISRAEAVAERGFAYAGDLTNRQALHERLTGPSPVIAISGHIHVREACARASLLQLSAGALVEPPYEIAVIEVGGARSRPWVRRRVRMLGPSPGARNPIFAPADETWMFDSGSWRRVQGLRGVADCLDG